jgi:hypothetical protein
MYPFVELSLVNVGIINWQLFYTGAVFNMPVSAVTIFENFLMASVALFSLPLIDDILGLNNHLNESRK